MLTEYTRDKVGNVTHIENPNDTETDLEYDRVYRTLSLINRQTGGGEKLNSAFAYTYNKVGHVVQSVNEYGWRNPSVATETYTYDGLHRLAGVVIDPIKNNGEKEISSYVYDPVGNRMEWTSLTGMSSQTLTDGFTKTYNYNAANQLLAVNDDSVKKNPNINLLETYTYDANGNRINRLRVDENDKNALIDGVDYSFDPENRLIQALDYQLGGKDRNVRTDRAVTDLEYDGGGRRMVQSYDPKSNAAKGVDKRTEYVFDGLDPVAEYSMLNGQRENFYRGDMNRIITMQHFNSGTEGQMFWYHYNHKGDVVGLTKQRGQSTHNYRYDAYGDVIPDNGNFTDPHNHYTLTGKEYDENTGLIWFGARHYDPGVGVWVTQDYFRGLIKVPMSLHRYGYLHDNPENYYDEYGNFLQVLGVMVLGGVEQVLSAYAGNVIENIIDENVNGLDVFTEPIDDADDWKGYGGQFIGGMTVFPGTQEAVGNYLERGFADDDWNLDIGEIGYDLSIGTATWGISKIIKPKVIKKIFPEGVNVGRPCTYLPCKLFGKKAQKNYIKELIEFGIEDTVEFGNKLGANFIIENILDCRKYPDARLYPNEPGYVDPYANFG